MSVVLFVQECPSCDTNAIDCRGFTALTIAVRNNQKGMVDFLLTHSDICLRDAELVATEEGNVTVVEKLLDWREKYDVFMFIYI